MGRSEKYVEMIMEPKEKDELYMGLWRRLTAQDQLRPGSGERPSSRFLEKAVVMQLRAPMHCYAGYSIPSRLHHVTPPTFFTTVTHFIFSLFYFWFLYLLLSYSFSSVTPSDSLQKIEKNIANRKLFVYIIFRNVKVSIRIN